MRKWYGAGERPTDGGPAPQGQEEEEPEAGDVVVVTAADSPVGEQVALQLILARQQLRLAVRDVVATKTAYGPYATPVPTDAVASARALRSCKALVVCGRPARGLLETAAAARVGHVVLLSGAAGSNGGGGFSLGGLFGGGEAARELRDLGDAAAEAAVRASGLPYTIVQVSALTDRSGGGGGAVSREALGALAAAVVDLVPARGRTLQAAKAAPAVPASGNTEAVEKQAEEVAAKVAAAGEDS
ncbi:hypothetical protein HYH03_008910 [Edaphochlamys debaryana]|uniref:NAD(P)-binding domain-containing protein n=1 Tax=Edaphochlamys debaryana TaxID=47281 RepID=A0A836BYY5_9CHLO|nr:hypothetical protein HYH03_008910 [Edaphochlamys debaryana]|eukprot:KAG2492744.1 hypothetical protein HYH03_008910 [Edaphochlamys debaryana]